MFERKPVPSLAMGSPLRFSYGQTQRSGRTVGLIVLASGTAFALRKSLVFNSCCNRSLDCKASIIHRQIALCRRVRSGVILPTHQSCCVDTDRHLYECATLTKHVRCSRSVRTLVIREVSSSRSESANLVLDLNDVPEWTPQTTRQRISEVLRIARAGASIRQLKTDVATISSNSDRERVVVSLLSELLVAKSFQRAADLQKLIRTAWLFHECSDVAKAFERGIEFTDADDLQSAESNFQRAVEIDPKFAEAWKKLSSVRYMHKNYIGALAACHRALVLEPAHFGALVGLSLVLQSLNRHDDAADAVRAASSVHPMSLPLRTNQFLSEVRYCLFSAPRLLYSPSGELAPHMGLIVITLCVLFDVVTKGSLFPEMPQMQTKEQVQTQVQIQTERRTLPDGSLEFRSNTVRTVPIDLPLPDLVREVEALESNSDRSPLVERLLDELGAAQTRDRAVVIKELTWRAMYFHESEDVAALIAKGDELMESGELGSAENLFKTATRLDDQYAEAWNRLATVHYLKGQYEASLGDIEETLELQPRHFGALSGRGLVLTELGRLKEADVAFREAQEVSPLSSSFGQNGRATLDDVGLQPID